MLPRRSGSAPCVNGMPSKASSPSCSKTASRWRNQCARAQNSGQSLACRAADNLKSAVFKADRFDPGLNRTYAETAGHYGTAILPARPYKPRDKAKVEVAVQVAQRWIVVLQARLWRDARLRNRRFFSLADLNAAIRRLLDELNMRMMRGYGASRADLFATIDRPNLEPLPPEPYAC